MCYSLWYNAPTMLPAGTPTMLPAGYLPATSSVHYTTSCNTQSSAPEDGQNNYPKIVELTGIINKPLLLHLVGYLYYLYQWCTVKQISDGISVHRPSWALSEGGAMSQIDCIKVTDCTKVQRTWTGTHLAMTGLRMLPRLWSSSRLSRSESTGQRGIRKFQNLRT